MDYQSEKVQLGQMQAQGLQQQAQLKQADIFDQFRQAKSDFDDACREYARISNIREQSGKRLADLQQKVAQLIQCALEDPTVPAMPQAANPVGGQIGNGRW